MLSYRIDPVAGIVYIEGEQSGNIHEFSRLLARVRSDLHYRPGFGLLRDRRALPAMKTSLLRSDVAALLTFFGREAGRLAFVITDPANYGMARIAGSLVDSSPSLVGIFDQLDAAEQWLRERPAPRGAQET